MRANLGLVRSIRWPRVIALSLAGAFLVMAAWELPLQLEGMGGQLGWAPGSDFDFYRSVATRWLETGQFYLPEQLAGPYVIVLNVHVLYPPPALYLFVPFVWLPAVLWWLVPLGVVGYAFFRWRPRQWTWPIIAFGLFWPATQNALLQGNTNMWVAAGLAGGLLWGWTAVLVVLKPTFAPLAVAGYGHRSWWVAWALVGIASLVLLPLWTDYLTTLRNSGIPWTYSLGGVPTMLIVVVAYIGRSPRPRTSTADSPVGDPPHADAWAD